jgi:hypothetical protein
VYPRNRNELHNASVLIPFFLIFQLQKSPTAPALKRNSDRCCKRFYDFVHAAQGIYTFAVQQEDVMKKLTKIGILAASAVLCAAPVSLHWSPAKTLSLSVDTAAARIGRPLTPGSVAGVNRRVHRRAYYGAAAAPYYNGRPACGYYPYSACY